AKNDVANRRHDAFVAREIACADDDQASIRLRFLDPNVGAEQVLEALSLFRAADEKDVLAPIHELFQRLAFSREVGVIDAVWDDVEVPGKVSADEAGGGGRDCYLAIEPPEPAPRDPRRVAVKA